MPDAPKWLFSDYKGMDEEIINLLFDYFYKDLQAQGVPDNTLVQKSALRTIKAWMRRL